ncbi:hypothetical protein KP509_17G034900 [Ceratopteris richardii]|uniref:Uncharacterized protein n=1 Tax=Ceratopteris richardii TaxID=49495 RepID=A0A8T2SU80_CERRI|nr:hypothetical protein KP509_17G034900 [Ceratopteris richardii]KAH7373052.1 hypothetical protein KP509_17G034900 [Ceratopteris richardii]KAH7373053.1 hypothetical protein KP509_17G034900 [Ceratopteris richardii]
MENSPPTTPLHSDQETSSGWGVAWGNWGNSAFSVFSGIQKVAVSAADEITKNALAVAKDAGRGMVELQDKVTSSLKMQSEDDATNASDTKETEDDTAELPEDKLRRVTLKKLEEAGQDGALSHVCHF